MEPLQTVIDDASLPYSCTTQIDDPLFSLDQLLGRKNSLEEDILLGTTPMNTCMMDEHWHAPFFSQCTGITVNDDSDTQMECPPLFESFIIETMISNADTLSSAAGSNLPLFLPREASSATMSDVNNTSFLHCSPGSDASFPLHQSRTNNNLSEHIDIDPLISVGAYGPAHTSYSGDNRSHMVTSDDSFLCRNVSSVTPSLNLSAGASLLQQHLQASGQCDKAAWPVKKDDVKVVTFLVKNGTVTIDDGYIWRKYGQKTIKDKIHPRAYYRCAQPNCPVKKQIESSSDVRGSVLITYIDKHNHDRPL